MQKVMKIMYECIMILLVMLTIMSIWTENSYNSTINWIVWAVFFTDFLIRFIATRKKWDFIKRNPFLLIAIIPLDQFFQVARIVRLIYLFRIKTIAKYYITPYIEKLTYKSMMIIISIILLLLFVESLVVWNLESAIMTYNDALYTIVGYLLFFGHQIIVIENPISIWFLTGTSIIGIAIQGLALQWIFSKVETIFINLKKRRSLSREC
ncbi:transporter [Virgibacillus byunsanensis]|uniref:Transporter n=1 Tax=Virgibacillus byunsanensis TaxID=570945 RepID=A0ABW3LNF8_9BACI